MPVPNTIADLNQAAGSNSPLGTDTVGPDLDNYLRAISAFVRQLFDGSPWMLSGVSGTDTITASSSVPFTAYVVGQTFRFVVAGPNTTNAPTLNINSIGAKPITRQGGCAPSASDLVGLVTVTYDGTQFQLSSDVAGSAHGQCRLSVTSTTVLTLAPFGGNNLIINGLPQVIPAAGVSYTLSGLAASTVYYVYAFMNSGVMTLEVTATTHATAGNGVEIKSGDATRTLVGMVRTNASTQFVNGSAQRFCLNWFNQRPLISVNTFGAQRATTSASAVEISSTERAEFLYWANNPVFGSITGTISSNAPSGTTTSNLNSSFGSVVGTSVSGNIAVSNLALVSPAFLAGEGYSYLTLFGSAVAGFTTGYSGGTTITAQIQG